MAYEDKNQEEYDIVIALGTIIIVIVSLITIGVIYL